MEKDFFCDLVTSNLVWC